MLTVLDLFSGVGGFSLGLERTGGFRTVAFCEVDPFCQRVLRKHWPGVPIFDDVRTLNGRDVGDVDVVCGGYPCQPYSVAGHRKGVGDVRDLAGEMLRIASEYEPAWVIGENVQGHIDLGLDAVCDGLERQGYTVRPLSVPTVVTGLPTMERHLWIIAAASSERLERCWQIALQDLEDGAQEFQGSDPRGLDRWNLSSSRVCGVGERIPGRMDRLRALGNAVPPDIPEIIGRAILAA